MRFFEARAQGRRLYNAANGGLCIRAEYKKQKEEEPTTEDTEFTEEEEEIKSKLRVLRVLRVLRGLFFILLSVSATFAPPLRLLWHSFHAIFTP
jgi:hypothetical protein